MGVAYPIFAVETDGREQTIFDAQYRVADTMVARSPSVRAITRSNPGQVPPLLIHVGKMTGCNCRLLRGQHFVKALSEYSSNV